MGMRLLAPDLLNYGSTRSNYLLPTPQMCSSVAPSNPFIPLLFVTSLENPQDSGSPSCFGRVLPTARAAGRFPACAAPLSPLGDAREPEKRRSDALGVSKEHKSCSFLAFFFGRESLRTPIVSVESQSLRLEVTRWQLNFQGRHRFLSSFCRHNRNVFFNPGHFQLSSDTEDQGATTPPPPTEWMLLVESN